MIRTQIQLPEPEYDELRTIAGRDRRSIADCIREGIRLFLRARRRASPGVDEIAGKFRPVDPSDLKDHDRWLADSIHGASRPNRHTRRK